jgi:hypothetical protein
VEKAQQEKQGAIVKAQGEVRSIVFSPSNHTVVTTPWVTLSPAHGMFWCSPHEKSMPAAMLPAVEPHLDDADDLSLAADVVVASEMPPLTANQPDSHQLRTDDGVVSYVMRLPHRPNQ